MPLFVTAEYRRGLIRTTLAATPTRMRVLAAKAAVLAAVTFVAGLVAAAVVVVLGQRVLRAQGVYVHPASTGTQVRIVVGTGALLAVAAILALALGTLIRGSVAAITAGVVVIVLPYVLAVTVLPDSVAEWMLRISPAAAFAVQQSATVYPQVANIYTPAAGYFPLPGWAGFAVLAGGRPSPSALPSWCWTGGTHETSAARRVDQAPDVPRNPSADPDPGRRHGRDQRALGHVFGPRL